MIGKLKGTVDEIGDDHAVVDVHGVGYVAFCSSRTLAKLAIGEGITTREQATIRLNGGQWDANVDQLARENEKLRAAQGQVDQSTAASGTISAALREAIVAEAIKSIKEGDKHENA